MSAPLGFNGRAASRGVPTPPAQLVAAAKKRDKFKSDAFVFPADLPSEYMFVMNTKTFKYKRKEGKETEIGHSYFLPIPNGGLTESVALNYSETEMGALAGTIADKAAGMVDKMKSLSPESAGKFVVDSIKDTVKAGITATDTMSGTDKIRALAAAVLPADGKIAGVAGQALGSVANPNVTAFFKGVNLRNYTFNWTLVPASSEEATALQMLINQMKVDSLPNKDLNGLALTYPKEAHIKIYTKGAQNMIVFKPTFITSINVEYASQGNFFHEDGKPGVIGLSVSVKEMDIWTGADYESGGAIASRSAAAEMGLGAGGAGGPL